MKNSEPLSSWISEISLMQLHWLFLPLYLSRPPYPLTAELEAIKATSILARRASPVDPSSTVISVSAAQPRKLAVLAVLKSGLRAAVDAHSRIWVFCAWIFSMPALATRATVFFQKRWLRLIALTFSVLVRTGAYRYSRLERRPTVRRREIKHYQLVLF